MIAAALSDLPGAVLSVFLVFCRIGSCLMLIPVFGSARMPMQVRLMLSIGASIAIASALGELEGAKQSADNTLLLGRLIAVEIAKGVFIGFMARFFFASLQFLADAAASAIGLNSNEMSAEDGEQLPAFASLVTLCASALFIATDQHLEILRALAQSYTVLGFGDGLSGGAEMAALGGSLQSASLLALQITAPFLVFAIGINFGFGILNRLVPQIPVFFISPPFIVGGGLLMFYFLSHDMFSIFAERFSDWLIKG